MNKISKIWIWFSIINACLVSVASLLGILNPHTYIQETANWAMQAVGQDVGNLLAAPALLISTYFLTKKSNQAFLIWLGIHLYLIYAYLVYAFFIHFNYLFLVYVTILGLSSYTMIGALLEQKLSNVLKPIVGKSMKFAGTLLIVTGGLFGFLWLSEVIPALISGKVPQSAATAGLWVNPIQVIDLALVLPGMILTGILVLRKRLLGYLFTAPWLTFSTLMGSSIVVTMILELNNGNTAAAAPLTMVGIIVILSVFALYLHLKESTTK
jgi:hypothetical protein